MRAQYVLLLLAMLAVLGTVNAGVVTLVGTCIDHPLQNGTILFILNNTGNDTANNLLLTPHIIGAGIQNSTYSVNAITPGGSVSIAVPINETSMHGSYVLYFDAAYQQGLSVFTAVFPCLIDVGPSTLSPIYITTSGEVSNNEAKLNVSIFNGFGENLIVNVSAIIPPGFKYLSNRYQLLEVSPYTHNSAYFALGLPQLSGSAYSGAIAAAYNLNGVEFSTMSVIKIFKPVSSYNMLYIAAWTAIIVVVAIILVLIFRAYRKRNIAAKNQGV